MEEIKILNQTHQLLKRKFEKGLQVDQEIAENLQVYFDILSSYINQTSKGKEVNLSQLIEEEVQEKRKQIMIQKAIEGLKLAKYDELNTIISLLSAQSREKGESTTAFGDKMEKVIGQALEAFLGEEAKIKYTGTEQASAHLNLDNIPKEITERLINNVYSNVSNASMQDNTITITPKKGLSDLIVEGKTNISNFPLGGISIKSYRKMMIAIQNTNIQRALGTIISGLSKDKGLQLKNKKQVLYSEMSNAFESITAINRFPSQHIRHIFNIYGFSGYGQEVDEVVRNIENYTRFLIIHHRTGKNIYIRVISTKDLIVNGILLNKTKFTSNGYSWIIPQRNIDKEGKYLVELFSERAWMHQKRSLPKYYKKNK